MYTYIYVKLRYIAAQEVPFLEYPIPNFGKVFLFNQQTLLLLCLNTKTVTEEVNATENVNISGMPMYQKSIFNCLDPCTNRSGYLNLWDIQVHF